MTSTSAATATTPAPVPALLDSIDGAERLDALVRPVRRVVRAAPLGRARELLRGLLGHPIHPTLVQLPVGAWTAAAIMDASGQDRAARKLIAVGLLGAGPAAVAGWTDWAELHETQMRTGLVHAASNITGVLMYATSLVARYTGHRRAGVVTALGGLLAISAGGLLGGHLAYRQAAGVNHAEPVPHLVPPGWHEIGTEQEFTAGRCVRRTIGEVPVAVVRTQTGAIHVLADQCSHLAGPLSEGEVADGCVTCPWHHSTFRLTDGAVVNGPATAPQPVFETRVRAGRLEVRLPQAG